MKFSMVSVNFSLGLFQVRFQVLLYLSKVIYGFGFMCPLLLHYAGVTLCSDDLKIELTCQTKAFNILSL